MPSESELGSFGAVATAELQSSLAKFVTFARSLKGDEKSEAQLFLDHFFRALGHGGVQEAGATLEFRIAKKPGSAQLELIKGDDAVKAKGGKKFADLLWPERVLIEMKSRKENLEKHYDQAFEYWTHIVPKRPPYVILCNFDEFWIYDFNTQLFDPVEKLLTRDLASNSAGLNFLLPHAQKPIFGNNRVEVTRKAADTFAEVFRKIVARGEDRTRAQRYILQLLVSVVAEDLGLLPYFCAFAGFRRGFASRGSLITSGLLRQHERPSAVSHRVPRRANFRSSSVVAGEVGIQRGKAGNTTLGLSKIGVVEFYANCVIANRLGGGDRRAGTHERVEHHAFTEREQRLTMMRIKCCGLRHG